MEAKLTTIICSIGEILRRFEYGISLANDMEHDLISVERTLDYLFKRLPIRHRNRVYNEYIISI